MNAISPRAALAVSLGIFCPLALAHPGHGNAIADSLLHPIAGLDHLVDMVGIGIWAAQQPAPARWGIPASFVALMGLAAWAGALGFAVPFIEHGIAASVLLTGLLILFSIKAFPASGMLLAAAFAVFHGATHGIEMPAGGAPLQFGFGFLAATALLHAAGVALSMALQRSRYMMQACGATIVTCGSLFALQWLH